MLDNRAMDNDVLIVVVQHLWGSALLVLIPIFMPFGILSPHVTVSFWCHVISRPFAWDLGQCVQCCFL